MAVIVYSRVVVNTVGVPTISPVVGFKASPNGNGHPSIANELMGLFGSVKIGLIFVTVVFCMS